jgi:hypothetical protein
VALAFGPNGFDDEKKRRAEAAEELLRYATNVFSLAAVGATVAFPPLAGGLALAAALGPFLQIPLHRIKMDPPRLDFYETAIVAPPLDPTAVIGRVDDPLNADVWPLPVLVAYSVAADRTAAHLGAMVTAAERAMGAYARRSGAAIDLRVAEVNAHASRALGSATAFHGASTMLSAFLTENIEYPSTMSGATMGDVLPEAVVNRLVSAGVADWFFWFSIEPETVPPEVVRGGPVALAGEAVYAFVTDLASDLPPTGEEFIAAGEDTSASTGGYA